MTNQMYRDENEALRAKLEEQRLEIEALRARAQASNKPRPALGIPRHVRDAFFKATGAKSATPEQIRAWATH